MIYRAFLSYSHRDEKWARWLLRKLEAYRVPANLVGTPGSDGPIPARLGKVFRDRDELPSAGNLSTTICAALENSNALVVICSPSSAQSRWVNSEVEAFRNGGRGDRVFSFVVDGDPSSRDPSRSCFPPALTRPDEEGGPENEPLAADARREGDGRDRAFIKLVAGLLGVGFDSLAQREAQQRNKRLATIAALALAGMSLAIVLAASAYMARNDAQRRQEQAEDILGFMLGDLRKNLKTVGRLDLMRSVDDKATGYFATLDPRDLSDRALEEQARSLSGIGEVRVSEGNHDEAMTAFREAHTRSTALYERAPGNGQRLFDLSQAEYWIGFVAWEQGRLEDAGVWLGKYRQSTVRLAAMDRTNFAWQREAAYGYQNLAVLDESLGRYAEAEQAMLEQRELYTAWVEQNPKDYELRYEAANVASWLGSLARRNGKLELAEMYFTEQAEAIARNMADDSENAKWKMIRVDSLQFLEGVQFQRGRLKEAQQSNTEALQIAQQLYALDPTNSSWIIALGDCHLRQAKLQPGNEGEHLEKAMTFFQMAYDLNPKNERLAGFMSVISNAYAQIALTDGDSSRALHYLKESAGFIEPFWQAEANEDLRVRKAEVLVLEGEICLHEGDRERADRYFGEAVSLLLEKPGSELPFTRLYELVRALYLLGKKEQAAPYHERLIRAGFIPPKPYSV